jgi:hypothetical protein
MWDDVFYQRAIENTIPHYRDSSAFLVEIPPPLMPPRMIENRWQWRMAGKVPVLDSLLQRKFSNVSFMIFGR